RLLDKSRTVTRSCRISCCFSAERCFHRSRLARSFLILRAAFPSSFITAPRHENPSVAGPDSGVKYNVRNEHRLDSLGDDWCVGLGDPELLEQLIHLRIGLQVQPGEPDPVPGQEIADPERVVRVTRADHA